jgi:uncharacterized membrane-anchored protein
MEFVYIHNIFEQVAILLTSQESTFGKGNAIILFTTPADPNYTSGVL